MKNLLMLAPAIIPFYYGNHTFEANAQFEGEIRFQLDHQPSAYEVKSRVDDQMFYAVYPLEERRAELNRIFELKNLDIKPLSHRPGYWSVHYQWVGKFEMTNPTPTHLQIPLMLEPSSLYDKVVINGSNLCGGLTSRNGLWVEWRLESSTCPLKQDVDYILSSVELNPISNTTQTYPEYDRLLNNSGEFKAALFWGAGSNQNKDYIKSLFNGYEVKDWSAEEIKKIAPIAQSDTQVFDMVKVIGDKKINLRIFFGESQYGSGSAASPFHQFLRLAFQDSAFIGYIGHAGYGHNLNINDIERAEKFKFEFSPQYQIFDIEACFPYVYYLNQYFDRKKSAIDPQGTKNLDVITTFTSSNEDPSSKKYFIEAIEKWLRTGKKASYQEILNNYFINPTSVNGDEDNPTSP